MMMLVDRGSRIAKEGKETQGGWPAESLSLERPMCFDSCSRELWTVWGMVGEGTGVSSPSKVGSFVEWAKAVE